MYVSNTGLTCFLKVCVFYSSVSTIIYLAKRPSKSGSTGTPETVHFVRTSATILTRVRSALIWNIRLTKIQFKRLLRAWMDWKESQYQIIHVHTLGVWLSLFCTCGFGERKILKFSFQRIFYYSQYGMRIICDSYEWSFYELISVYEKIYE